MAWLCSASSARGGSLQAPMLGCQPWRLLQTGKGIAQEPTFSQSRARPPLLRVSAVMQSHADPQNTQGQGWEGRRRLRSAHPTRRLSASLALQHKVPRLPLLGAAITGFYRQGN